MTAALAQDAGPSNPAETDPEALEFAVVDTDGDGSITETEAESYPVLAELFTALDIDNSNGVTEAEFVMFATLAQQRRRTFETGD